VVGLRTIQINYDLSARARNYGAIEGYIKSSEVWCHLLESLRLVRTWKTASDVRDELKAIVHPQDKVATFDVTGIPWATNFTADTTNWMHRHMRAA
jgi:hypothetical protein